MDGATGSRFNTILAEHHNRGSPLFLVVGQVQFHRPDSRRNAMIEGTLRSL